MYIVEFCYDLWIFNGKRIEIKYLWPNLSDYLSIFLEGLRKIRKIIIKNNQCPGRDSKSLSPSSNQICCRMKTAPSGISLSKALLKSRKSDAFHQNSTAPHSKDLNPQEQWLYRHRNITEKMASDSCECAASR
jgi:hypothetical protein